MGLCHRKCCSEDEAPTTSIWSGANRPYSSPSTMLADALREPVRSFHIAAGVDGFESR